MRIHTTVTKALAAGSILLAPVVAPAPHTAAAEQTPTLASTYANIDANLSNLHSEAASLSTQTAEVNATIAKLEAESAALTPVIQQKQETLRESIQESYMTGEKSSLKVVASSESLSNMLGQQHYRDQIGSKTQQAASDLTKARQELQDKIDEAQKKRDGLQALKSQLDEKIATAEAQVAARKALEEATQNKEEEFQKIQAQIQQEEAASLVAPSAAPSVAPRPSNNDSGGGNPGFSGRSNPYPYGQCTWYVYDQTGRGQNGNAGSWRPTSSTPGVGKIMIWRAGEQGAGGAGHVGVVIGVSGNTVTIRHMNWRGVGVVSTETFQSTGKFY